MGCSSSQPAVKNETRGPQAHPAASTFRTILDQFETIEEVQQGLRKSGLESSEVILAIDFTKSNEWAGKNSFEGRCLHTTDPGVVNPYQSVISIICQTLASFDDDHLIPAFGFGDSSSRDHSLISLDPHLRPIHTFENVLQAYNDVVRRIHFSGPTSFAPAINNAIKIVEESHGQYHILVIIADGQVVPGKCTQETIQAIVRASDYPLSIVMVGVGDGPWDAMQAFDDQLPQRTFDNFQFVNFSSLAARDSAAGASKERWEADFALDALQEIPEQFRFIQAAGMVGRVLGRPIPPVRVLPPPTPSSAGQAPLHMPGQGYSDRGYTQRAYV